MAPDGTFTQELSWDRVIAKTFELYQRNFVKYFILYLVVEAIIGVVSTLAYRAFPLPTLQSNATPQQIFNWMPGFFGNLILLLTSILIVGIIFGTIALGGTIKMASDEMESRPVNLMSSVRFAVSKLIWMWALGIIVGIIVGLGFIALVIPGIILLIMFCLTYPALLIENSGVIGSLGRSRELVGHRWLKTFVIFIIFFIILAIANSVVGLISSPFGAASNFVSSVLSAFYQPLVPVAITVYYYSNLARTSPGQVGSGPKPPQTMAPPGMKFCPNCGTQLVFSATFCSKCGAKQPV